MRIGTWNLEGRDGYHLTPPPLAPSEYMTNDGKQWAVVASKTPLVPRPAPHPTSTAAVIGTTTFISSVLPWAGSGGAAPWRGDDHAQRMAAALSDLRPFLLAQPELVWGGDWNHSLFGSERAGSYTGREHLHRLLAELHLRVPTAHLEHRVGGLLSIDHIALQRSSQLGRRVIAERGGQRLSDHDLYFVDV